MNATKTERFFLVKIDLDLPDCEPIDVVVDRSSKLVFNDPTCVYQAVHYKAYSRPANVKWTLAVSPNGNPFFADREWLSAVYVITRSVQEGETVQAGDYMSRGRVSAVKAPGFFSQICSAFRIANPIK